jgi:hypothetical protein
MTNHEYLHSRFVLIKEDNTTLDTLHNIEYGWRYKGLVKLAILTMQIMLSSMSTKNAPYAPKL